MAKSSEARAVFFRISAREDWKRGFISSAEFDADDIHIRSITLIVFPHINAIQGPRSDVEAEPGIDAHWS